MRASIWRHVQTAAEIHVLTRAKGRASRSPRPSITEWCSAQIGIGLLTGNRDTRRKACRVQFMLFAGKSHPPTSSLHGDAVKTDHGISWIDQILCWAGKLCWSWTVMHVKPGADLEGAFRGGGTGLPSSR